MMLVKSNIISSIFWQTAERAISQGLGVVVQIILARLLLPVDFAQLSIINAIIVYLGIFVQSGLSVAVVQKKNIEAKDLSTLFCVSLSIALILYFGLFFLAPVISDYYNMQDLVWPIRIMSLTLFLYSFNSIQTGILRRRMAFRSIFFRTACSLPLSAIVGIILAYRGLGVWALIAYNLLNILLTVVFMNMMPSVRVGIGFSWKSCKELYSFSIKILATNLVSGAGDAIRTMTIGKTYSPSDLAYFDRANHYSRLVSQIINSSISSVVLSILSRKQDDVSKILDISRRTVRMSGFLMIPLLCIVAIIAKPLVLVLLTYKWISCAPYLSLLCLMRIPGMITAVDRQAYYALGHSQIGLYYEIGLLVVNIAMLVVTIPLGVIYIAVGAVCVEFLGNFVLIVISKFVYSYNLLLRLTDLAKPIVNVVIMSICVIPISIVVSTPWILIILQILSGLFVYIILSIVMKDANLFLIINKITAVLKDFKIKSRNILINR